MGRLANVLHNDLTKTRCDSLVIVYYQCEGSSKFFKLEEYGIMKLTYNSIEGFHSALQQIILSEIVKNNKKSKKVQELAKEIQAWFLLRIYDFPRAQKAIRKIQTWFRQIQKPYQPHQPNYLDNIYNDVMVFCKDITGEEEEEEKTVRTYNILLRGQTVDTIVKLTDLQGKMNTIKNKLRNLIQRHSPNANKIELYLELEEEKFVNIYLNI
ncbi:hypothetical protein C1645_751494 [Glomus cerebriforme]|uniref:Uncharacterized protein n=1 Tax=Glomus cerebriforme TaxID=658196 RepID=A0A397THQ1_9GLOM|nr:hypothetical protein C1645_751494 [Glomus cerebriforme]